MAHYTGALRQPAQHLADKVKAKTVGDQNPLAGSSWKGEYYLLFCEGNYEYYEVDTNYVTELREKDRRKNV